LKGFGKGLKELRRNLSVYILAGCVVLVFAGCGGGATLRPKPSVTLPSPSMPAPETPQPDAEAPSPRAIAALSLSNQAKTLLDENQPDQAIRVLEQAINLHPQQGEAYYYLAAAWLQKGNYTQAIEFNRLAEIYYKDNDLWLNRISFQKNRISQLQP
jgi:tetratricopeptide (TPR) repeat protein